MIDALHPMRGDPWVLELQTFRELLKLSYEFWGLLVTAQKRNRHLEMFSPSLWTQVLHHLWGEADVLASR